MSCEVRLAYRDNGEPSGWVPQDLIPPRVELGDITKTRDMFLSVYQKDLNGRLLMPVFFDLNNKIRSIYYKKSDDKGRICTICLVKKDNHPLAKGGRLFYDDGDLFWNTIGDIELYVDDGTIVCFHILPEDVGVFQSMLDDLKLISESLLKDRGSTVKMKTGSQDADSESISDEGETDTKTRSIIDTPDRAQEYLDRLDKLFGAVQLHAETDLKQEYEKMDIRKVKHFTARTLVEYYNTQNPKVRAITTKEHYDIYEHRMMVCYLDALREDFVKKQADCRRIILKHRSSAKKITDNKGILQESLGQAGIEDSDLADKKKEEIETKLNTELSNLKEQVKTENKSVAAWGTQMARIDEMKEKYEILHVRDRGEQLHSSMLFLRNRYYRDIYHELRWWENVSVSWKVDSMPVRKLYNLYERWCYFKLISVFTDTYGFDICGYALDQKAAGTKDCNAKSLSELIRKSVGLDDGELRYLRILLKKQIEIDSNKIDSNKIDQFAQLEYQRIFEVKDDGQVKRLIPDFCLTMWEKKEDAKKEDAKKLFILDAKYKEYKGISLQADMVGVSWYKYKYLLEKSAKDSENGVKVSGSYILHQDEDSSWSSNLQGTVQECYGLNVMNDDEISWLAENEFPKGIGLPPQIEDRMIGAFLFKPGIGTTDPGKRLLRMILEWIRPYTMIDEEKLLVWKQCLLCGGELNITIGKTGGDYNWYHISCVKCGESWVKIHCVSKGCNEGLIKHKYHNYILKGSSEWDLICPKCGNGRLPSS